MVPARAVKTDKSMLITNTISVTGLLHVQLTEVTGLLHVQLTEDT